MGVTPRGRHSLTLSANTRAPQPPPATCPSLHLSWSTMCPHLWSRQHPPRPSPRAVPAAAPPTPPPPGSLATISRLSLVDPSLEKRSLVDLTSVNFVDDLYNL